MYKLLDNKPKLGRGLIGCVVGLPLWNSIIGCHVARMFYEDGLKNKKRVEKNPLDYEFHNSNLGEPIKPNFNKFFIYELLKGFNLVSKVENPLSKGFGGKYSDGNLYKRHCSMYELK